MAEKKRGRKSVTYPAPWTTSSKPTRGRTPPRRRYQASGSKYKNEKVKVDGMTFDSVKEYRRWNTLMMLQEKGAVRELRRQVKFPLLPAQHEALEDVYKRGPKAGQPKPGRCIERAVDYVADFTYWRLTPSGGEEFIVEDAKGYRTDDYVIKRKLMLWIHGIRIVET